MLNINILNKVEEILSMISRYENIRNTQNCRDDQHIVLDKKMNWMG